MNRLLLIVLAGLVGLSTSCTAKPTASASLATEPSAESTTLSAELNDTAATPAIESKSMDAEQGAAASPLNVSDKTTSQLTIVAWNVESGGADPKVISQRLATFHADIYGLSEVHRMISKRFGRRWVKATTKSIWLWETMIGLN